MKRSENESMGQTNRSWKPGALGVHQHVLLPISYFLALNLTMGDRSNSARNKTKIGHLLALLFCAPFVDDAMVANMESHINIHG